MKILALFLAVLMLFGTTPEVTAYAAETEELEFEISPIDFSYPEAVIRKYFGVLYRSYREMLPVDISPVIDLDYEMMQNVQDWNNNLALRRSIIDENEYCYVEKEFFDYEIKFITKKDLEDQRMYHIDFSQYGKDYVVMHFVIEGIPGTAYPPIFAVNSQHTMILTKEGENYKIAYHYFPGSEGKFENDLPAASMTKERLEELVHKEFSGLGGMKYDVVKYKQRYNADATVEYALAHCENKSDKFLFVGDWYGNCMNFASQCIWTGFKLEGDTPANGGSMTSQWYCNRKSGTLIWTSVSRFWGWTQTRNCSMQIKDFYDVKAVRNGDLVHIGSYLCKEENKYTHALIVVDEDKLLLAQNSPACFVYYSDLVNNYYKFIRPVSINA